MTWLKVWSTAWKSPKLAGLKTDSERYAYMVALQEQKAIDGKPWANRRHFEANMGPYGRHFVALKRANLLDELPDGRIQVHDFEARQASSDPTAAERQRRFRERQKATYAQVDNGVDTRDVTPSRNARDVTSRSLRVEQNRADVDSDTRQAPTAREGESSDDVPDDEEDDVDALAGALVMAGVWRRPTKAMIGFLANLIRDHGAKGVEGAIAARMKKPIGDDFMGDVADDLRKRAIEQSEAAERRRIEADRKAAEADSAAIEKAQRTVTPRRAAEQRAALAQFVQGLGTEGKAS